MKSYPPLSSGEKSIQVNGESEEQQELLYRQKKIGHYKPDAQYFNLRPDPEQDAGCLSVYRGSIVSAEGAYLQFKYRYGGNTCGSLAVSVKTVAELDLRIVDDFMNEEREKPAPLGHAYIDFRYLNLALITDTQAPTDPATWTPKRQWLAFAMLLYEKASMKYEAPKT